MGRGLRSGDSGGPPKPLGKGLLNQFNNLFNILKPHFSFVLSPATRRGLTCPAHLIDDPAGIHYI